jgi:para-aminobenzoate synthetase component 1
MELIEDYESIKRGLYSGAVGYITPEEDFDFNVVIRSLIYNKQKQYVSAIVGGAITDKSDPEKEYDECLLKAKPLFDTLNTTA